MKIYYDNEADSAYIRLSEKKPTGVIEVSDFINLDTNEQGEVIGIEILNASKKIKINSLFNFKIDANFFHREKPHLRFHSSQKKRTALPIHK